MKVPNNVNQLESIMISIVLDTKNRWKSTWKYNNTKPVPVLDEKQFLTAEVQNHDTSIRVVTIRHGTGVKMDFFKIDLFIQSIIFISTWHCLS